MLQRLEDRRCSCTVACLASVGRGRSSHHQQHIEEEEKEGGRGKEEGSIDRQYSGGHSMWGDNNNILRRCHHQITAATIFHIISSLLLTSFSLVLPAPRHPRLLLLLLLLLSPVITAASSSGRQRHHSHTRARSIRDVFNLNSSSSSSSMLVSPQCLVLERSVTQDICQQKLTERTSRMREVRLRFCDSFLVYNAINSTCVDALTKSQDTCTACFQQLESLDQQAAATYCHFQEVMRQFDCDTPYSTHGNCKQCQVSTV